MSKSRYVRTAPSPHQTSFIHPIPISNEGRLAPLPHRLRAALIQDIKASPLSRYEIAGKISELLDRDLSKDMLDKYTAESADGHRLPAEVVPAFCLVTHSAQVLEVLAGAVNYALVPVGVEQEPLPADLRSGLLIVTHELGEAAGALERSLKDGRVTATETERCRKELWDVIRAAVRVHRRLEIA